MEGRILIGGVLNRRVLEWGMPHPCSRGKRILKMAAKAGFAVLNTESIPTFQCPSCTGKHSRRNFHVGMTGVIIGRVASSGKLLRKRPSIHRECSDCHNLLVFTVSIVTKRSKVRWWLCRNSVHLRPCRWTSLYGHYSLVTR